MDTDKAMAPLSLRTVAMTLELLMVMKGLASILLTELIFGCIEMLTVAVISVTNKSNGYHVRK